MTLEQYKVNDSLNSELLGLAKTHFGIEAFRKGQLDIIKSVVAQKDALAVMPTGGGKSLCYQLPSLHLKGLVVVVSPLIALMKDQVRNLQKIGLRAGCIHSGQSMEEKRLVFSQIRTGDPFVLYLSPERVQNEGFTAWIKKQAVSLFAIDEAHCVSQWGPDFREDYNKLKILRELRPDIPILALTATATPEVLADVSRQLSLKKPDRHVHGFYRPNLFYQVETCADDNFKFAFLLNALRKNPKGRVLIYCGTRQQCEDITDRLGNEFAGVGFYHAGISAEGRKEIQEKVDRSEIRILAATNAFGMGIDYPDVRLVVHYQMPANVESFYQEAGRAGRDGQMSLCLLLYSKKDKGLQSFFIQQSDAESFVIKRRWDTLNALIQFIEGGECRHSGILTYFKDSDRIVSCGHCDVCAPGSSMMIPLPVLQASVRSHPKPKRRSAKAAQKASSEELDSPEAESRHLILKDWRKSYAKEHDLPAFMVFSNRTLVDLSNKNPTSLSELEQVYGFGPAKVELFGHLILAELGHR